MASVRPKNRMPVEHYSGPYRTAGQYADALRAWMTQMYHLQCISASFPYFLASLQSQSSNRNNTGTSVPTGASRTNDSTNNQQTPQQREPTPPQQDQQQAVPRHGVEYAVPSLWKRVAAEVIDFILLFAVKLSVTYAAVDAFDLLQDLENYDLEKLSADIFTDYWLAFNMTSEILLLELIHRIGTCAFEALCLYRGRGRLGGSTPGKQIMGLAVVRCSWVVPTLGDKVIVYPATDLGFGRALTRSVIKNVCLAFLFPICLAFFSFQHNRTIYDVVAGSIVVEVRAPARFIRFHQ